MKPPHFAVRWLTPAGPLVLVCAAHLASSARAEELVPREPLTLREATRRALEHSPELAVRIAAQRASSARVSQASARPNPELRLMVENVAGTGDHAGVAAAETTLLVSQVFELGGKRAARERAARADELLTTAELEAKRRRLAREILAAFVHVAGDEHGVEVARASVSFAEEHLTAAGHRVSAGAASRLEEHRARIDLARARIDLEHAEHELLSSRRHLASLWGASEPDFDHVSADLFRRYELPSFDALALALEQNDELGRWTHEATARAAQAELSRTRSVPNLTLGAGARRLERSDDLAFVFEVAMPLPVFDRGEGASLAADAHAEQARLERDASHVRLRAVLFGTYQELVHASTALQSLEREVLPEAEKMMQAVRDGLERGRFSQLEVLDAARTLTAVRRERIELAVQYHRLIAEVEGLVGAPFVDPGQGATP